MVNRHKFTVFYLKSIAIDSMQVGKAAFVKERQLCQPEPRTFSSVTKIEILT